MDKYRRPLLSLDASKEEDAAIAAESVRTDFSELLSLIERQLGNLTDVDDRARPHLLEAKAAAQRGLILSMQLIEAVRAFG